MVWRRKHEPSASWRLPLPPIVSPKGTTPVTTFTGLVIRTLPAGDVFAWVPCLRLRKHVSNVPEPNMATQA
jgi:hypothetical protein